MAAERQARDSWSGRTAFLCACVGSAVGLGNVWRFPTLVHQYGGGAFLIPYFFAMCLVGLPVLTLEMASGQVFRAGGAGAFSSINKRFGGIGAASVICGFVLVTYYVVILAWAGVMLVHSFSPKGYFPWERTRNFFVMDVINVQPQHDGELSRSTAMVTHTLAATTIVWLVVFLCVMRGPRTTGRIAYVTMGLPVVFVLFLAIFFGVQDGASRGLDLYVTFNISKITGSEGCGPGRSCVEAWPDAVSQAFFSLSVTLGVMAAYSSYNPRRQGVQVNAVATVVCDVFVSILSGVMVFGALGITDDLFTTGGMFLVFDRIPKAISKLHTDDEYTMGICRFVAVLFFITALLLGIDSAFSLVEASVTTLKDSRLFRGWSRASVCGAFCIAGWILSAEFCVDTGVFSMDSFDYYNGISMLFIGLMQCIAAGWFYKYQETVERVGRGAFWTLFGTMFMSMYVGARVGLGVGSYERLAEVGTAVGVLSASFIMVLGSLRSAWLARAHKGLSAPAATVLYDLFLWNVEELRGTFNGAAGVAAGNISIPMVWSVLIKFVIPPVLLLMIMLKFVSSTFGNLGYHQWYQGWAIGIDSLAWLAIALNLFHPGLFDFLLPATDHAEEAAQRTDVGQQQSEHSYPVPVEVIGNQVIGTGHN